MKVSTFIHYILCPIFLLLSVLSMLWLYAGFVAMWTAHPNLTLWEKFVFRGHYGPYLGTLFSFTVIILGKWYMKILAVILFMGCLYLIYFMYTANATD